MRNKTVFAFVTAVLAFAAAGSAIAGGKQCVWNKSGFVLRVDWLDHLNGAIVATDIFPTAQGRCQAFQSTPRLALMSIEGAEIASWFLSLPASAILSASAGVEAAMQGENYVDTFKDQVHEVHGSVRKDFIWFGTPYTDRYVDVWGTIWDPQFGQGGGF